MDFKFEDKESVHVLYITGNFLSEPVANDEILQHVNKKIEDKTNKYILDLSGINVINSSGLGVLIKILTKSRTIGGDAVLINVPEQLSKLLLVTKLNTVFKTFDNFDEAHASLNAN